jgi:acyl-CoA thioester hydrolase
MPDLQNLPRELESTAIARFQDCDPFNHLNNARYIDYFLNSREDQLALAYNLDVFDHGKTLNANWVTTKNQIAYLRPVQVMEEIRIRTRLIYFNEKSLVVEGLMLDKNAQRLKCFAWIEFAYVSVANGRSTNHPDELMQLFHEVAYPNEFDPDGFNRRIDAVRLEVRNNQ